MSNDDGEDYVPAFTGTLRKGKSEMSTDLTVTNNTAFPTDGGWSHAAKQGAKRGMIEGTFIKFADAEWTEGGMLMKAGRRLIAGEIIEGWQKWLGGRPDAVRIIAPDEVVLREDLGDNDPKDWERGMDKQPKDPWQHTWWVRFADPLTAEIFTYSTGTVGGDICVTDLANSVVRFQKFNPGALPIVTFETKEMPTRHGKVTKRPYLAIVGWFGGRNAAPPQLENGSKDPFAKEPEDPFAKKDLRDDLNDDLPF
jgi:hypothetical protein